MKKILLSFISFFIIFTLSFANLYAETSYIYYWGQWCQYCAKVNKYLKSVDETKVNIEKREVYFDKDNAAQMSIDTKRVWKESAWVPFLIINKNWNESFFSWYKEIIDHFVPILWEVPKNNNKVIVFSVLGILAFLIPLAMIFSNRKQS